MKFSIHAHNKNKNKMTIPQWVEAYKRYIAVGGVIIFLAVVLVVTLVGKGRKKNEIEIDEAALTIAEESVEVEEVVEEPNDLLLNAYPEINAMMELYYTSMAAGDVEQVKAMVDVLSEEEQSYIESLKTLIEGYQNIRCYTKRGMEEGSYLVFVRYDLKFIAVESVAPGVQGYYVKTDASGSPYIFLGAPDEALTAYVNEIVQHADVQAMYDEVWAEFDAAKASDEKLAEYGTKLEQLKNGEVSGEAAGEENVEAEETPAEGETAEETGEGTETESEAEAEAPSAGESTAVNKETRFKETTNVRAARTTDSERLNVGYQGEKVTHVESYEDGWSKIVYKGEEGYCKTEYLE